MNPIILLCAVTGLKKKCSHFINNDRNVEQIMKKKRVMCNVSFFNVCFAWTAANLEILSLISKSVCVCVVKERPSTYGINLCNRNFYSAPSK